MVILFCIVYVGATVLALAWLLAGWIYREFAYRGLPSDPRGLLRLSAAERATLDELRDDLTALREEVNGILAQGAALARRQDGYFHERGQGRELNARLRPAIAEGRRLEERIAALEATPQKHFAAWSQRRSKLSASRFAMAWLAVAFVVFAVWRPEWLPWAARPVEIVELAVRGRVVLADPGFVAYTAAAIWATWFAFGFYFVRKNLVARSHEGLVGDRPAAASWGERARQALHRVLG